MTSLILSAALKGTIVLGRCLDCHRAAARALSRSAASHLAGRAHRDGAVACAGIRAADDAHDDRCERRCSRDRGGCGGALDAFARDRLVVIAALLLLRWGAGVLRLYRITRRSRAAGAVLVSDAIQTP